MREFKGEKKSKCCLVRAQEYIYVCMYVYVFFFFLISNFFNIDELPVIVGVVMMFVVAAEFGGGAEMCEDFYFYYFR